MGLSQTVHVTSHSSSMLPNDRNNLSHSAHGDPLLGGSSFHGTTTGSFNFGNRQQPQGMGNAPTSLNEAMEKLCGSMKRSAMSRSMVKQFSGRSLSRQGSMRQLSRQNSGVMRQGSDRSLLGDSGRGVGPTMPVRIPTNAKHQLQHPSRGVFRHDSQQSLGQSGHGGMPMQPNF